MTCPDTLSILPDSLRLMAAAAMLRTAFAQSQSLGKMCRVGGGALRGDLRVHGRQLI